eukprot:TRINITY_DN75266_c0_g1_i1.p1 TRINITY_DN75266_c0_g1~~TRINITY_DN75266_c0_g1_i1.p1  ORF type:complete len:274 (-),score=19.49 TRINITY_DN75266_c0_g1_i1:301-1122(-)
MPSPVCADGLTFECLLAPLSKAQRRLERRKLHWLHSVAYSRTTLLAMRTSDLMTASTLPSSMFKISPRPTLVSTASQTDLLDARLDSPQRADDLQTQCFDTSSALTQRAEDDDAEDAFAKQSEVELLPLSQLTNTLSEWTVMLEAAVARAKALLPICVEESERLLCGTVVLIEDRFSWLFPFSDCIGVVEKCCASGYNVRFLSTGQHGRFPALKVRELIEAQICNLVQRSELNGQCCFVDGLVSKSPCETRLRVDLLNGGIISLRPECLADLI